MNIKEILLMIAGVFVNLILETVVFTNLNIQGIRPDTIIIACVSIGVIKGSVPGAVYGILAGALIDVLYSPYIGFYALGYGLAGFIAGLVSFHQISQSLIIPSIFSFVLYLLKEAVVGLQLFILGGRYNIGNSILRYFLPSALLTAVLVLPIFAYIRHKSKRQWRRARWNNYLGPPKD